MVGKQLQLLPISELRVAYLTDPTDQYRSTQGARAPMSGLRVRILNASVANIAAAFAVIQEPAGGCGC